MISPKGSRTWNAGDEILVGRVERLRGIRLLLGRGFLRLATSGTTTSATPFGSPLNVLASDAQFEISGCEFAPRSYVSLYHRRVSWLSIAIINKIMAAARDALTLSGTDWSFAVSSWRNVTVISALQ